MTIYDFQDYRPFLRAKFALGPHKGRGRITELANYLKMHPTVVSQILSGQRFFSEEQAYEICEFLDLTEDESAYFRLLARFDSAGTHKLKSALKAELANMRAGAKSLVNQVRPDRALTDAERAIFYSSWLYSAVRLYCSTVNSGRTQDEVAARFLICRPKAASILNFLAQFGLVKKVADKLGDKFVLGTQTTYLAEESPFHSKHHSNWRIKAIELSDSLSKDELTFTGPFSVSRADFGVIRGMITEFIQAFSSVVKDSEAEEIACLNVDLFLIRK